MTDQIKNRKFCLGGDYHKSIEYIFFRMQNKYSE